MVYEIFSLYGIRLKYPEKCIIRPSSQLERLNGEISFIFDGKDTSKLVFSWKPLSYIKRKYQSVEEFSETVIKLMRKDRALKSLEILEHKILKVNGHKAIFYHVKLELYKPVLFGFKPKIITQNIRFAVIFCEESDRYITLYSEEISNSFSLQEEYFEDILNSIICH